MRYLLTSKSSLAHSEATALSGFSSPAIVAHPCFSTYSLLCHESVFSNVLLLRQSRDPISNSIELLRLLPPRSSFPGPCDDSPRACAEDTSPIGSLHGPPRVRLACPAGPHDCLVRTSLLARSGPDSRRSPGYRVGPPRTGPSGPLGPLRWRLSRPVTALVADRPETSPSWSGCLPLARPSSRCPAHMGRAKRDPPRATGVTQRDKPCLTAGLDEIAVAKSQRVSRRGVHEFSELLRPIGGEAKLREAAGARVSRETTRRWRTGGRGASRHRPGPG
jgi:hypothetical protein